MPKTYTHAPKPRTTLPLRGTVSTPELKLDFRSQLAMEWARAWLKLGPGDMGVDPLLSGVVRRALAVYVKQLERADLDPAQEARAVRSACSASTYDPEDRDAAWKRAEAHQRGQPFPTFASVLHGPQDRSKWLSELEDRVDALVAEMTANKPGQRARRPTTT